MNDIMVIGIAGGTGSGKTTITGQISERLGNEVTVITHDNYYRAHHEMTYEERTLLNYDHPDAYETELLVEHLAALRRGEAVEVPVYDFTTYDRTDDGHPEALECDLTLHFPREFDEDLRRAIVSVRGTDYDVVGTPVRYTDANLPPGCPWNLTAKVVRHDG